MRSWFLTWVALAACAEAEVVLSLDGSGERLSRGSSLLWWDGQAELAWARKDLRVSGGWREVRRYGLRDAEAMLDADGKLGEWVVALAGTRSADELLLPVWSGQLQLGHLLAKGLVATASYRQATYRELTLLQPSVQMEWYTGAFRVAGAVGLDLVPDENQGVSEKLSLDWYWSEHSSLRIGMSHGQDCERDQGRLLLTDVIGGAMLLRHQILPRLGMHAVLDWTKQGQVHQRAGVGLGMDLALGS